MYWVKVFLKEMFKFKGRADLVKVLKIAILKKKIVLNHSQVPKQHSAKKHKTAIHERESTVKMQYVKTLCPLARWGGKTLKRFILAVVRCICLYFSLHISNLCVRNALLGIMVKQT